jgi:hypothetical protein
MKHAINYVSTNKLWTGKINGLTSVTLSDQQQAR